MNPTPSEFAALVAVVNGNTATLRAASQTANVFKQLGLATALTEAANTAEEGLAAARARYDAALAREREEASAVRLPYKE